VTAYLDTLAWDGTSRINRRLLDYARVEDSEYARAVERQMLVAAAQHGWKR
jgi:predicted P-loop ATPase